MLRLSPDDAIFRSINRMPFGRKSHPSCRKSHSECNSNSEDCPQDASVFSRLPLDGINLLGNTF